MVCTPKGMMAVIDALAVITKVHMPSVSTKLPAEPIQPPELIVRLLGDIMVHCTASGTDDVVA